MITRREIYLDCNATHPLLPTVRQGLAEALLERDPALGNPASIHRHGQKAKKAVAELRETLCRFLGRGEGDEFIFVSGATEAINLALRGFCDDRRGLGRRVRLIASQVEHPAILDTIAALDATPSSLIPVMRSGELDREALFKVIDEALAEDEDVLLCLQACNNETGVAFDLDATLGEIHARYGRKPQMKRKKEKGGQYPLSPQRVWTLLDAAQALGKLDPAKLRRALHFADYAALSAHKMGGPAGTGALWLRPKSPFKSQMTGGSQEKKRRAGTFNALGALGFKLALDAWLLEGAAWRARLKEFQLALAGELRQVPGLVIHGLGPQGELPELANTLNFHVTGCPEESLLLALDLDGFCVSSGSACNSGSLKPSHVLLAMGYGRDEALSSVRVCFGVETTRDEIMAFAGAVKAKAAHILDSRRRSSELLPDIQI